MYIKIYMTVNLGENSDKNWDFISQS